MLCETILKLDAHGRVKIPLKWRRDNGLKGGELLNVRAGRIELVDLDRMNELDKENVPGAATPISGTKRTRARKHKEVLPQHE